MKLISSRPTRLFCPQCDEIYNLPQGGAIKLYKVSVCVILIINSNFSMYLYAE